MKLTHLRSLGLFAIFSHVLLLQVNAQEPVKLAAHEIKNFDMGTEVNNVFDGLTAAQKTEGKEKAQITAAYFIKAVMHRGDKTKYPIDASSNSLEKLSFDLIKDIPDNVFARIKLKVDALHGDPQFKSTLLGKYAGLDFAKPSLTPQIKSISGLELKPVKKPAIREASMLQFNGSLDNAGNAVLTASEDMKGNPGAAPKFIDLVLRAVHCVDETNPEGSSDEIVMSALLVGASGNTNNARGLDCGDYDDGTYRNWGYYPFGSYSMTTTGAYPKVFYAVLQMVEVDTDEKEMVIMLNQAMYGIGAIIASAWGLGAIVIAVGQAVDLILGWLIDDDALNVYGIQLTMNSANSLKVNGQTVSMVNGSSSNWCTGNITGHGGTYRVGFKCQLRY